MVGGGLMQLINKSRSDSILDGTWSRKCHQINNVLYKEIKYNLIKNYSNRGTRSKNKPLHVRRTSKARQSRFF